MKLLIILELFFLNFCKTSIQVDNSMIRINAMSVYKDFQGIGYTTVGAISHFDEMKEGRIKTLAVVEEDIKRLEKILNKAEKKKLYQTKHGGDLIFCDLVFNSQTNHKMIITKSGCVYNIFGKIKEERAFITDLTNKLNYKITNHEDLKWLKEFAERIKK